MKAYQYKQFGLENLVLVELDEPRAGPYEVLVRYVESGAHFGKIVIKI